MAQRREENVVKRSRGTKNSLPYLERSGDVYFTASQTLNMHSLSIRILMEQIS